MARDFPASLNTTDPTNFAGGAAITSAGAEVTLQQNVNWLQANMIRPLAWDVFGTPGYQLELSNPWLDVSTGNDSSATIVASYRIRVPRDFATYRVKAWIKNAHASAAGLLGVKLASGSTVGTAAIAAGDTGSIHSVDIAVNTSLERETIYIGIQNGSSDSAGVCSIQAVMIYPVPLASPLAAGASTQGFIPIDQGETSVNLPVSTHLRATMMGSLSTLTKKRRASALVTWSDNWDERNRDDFMMADGDASYTKQTILPVYIPAGFSKLQWSLAGYTHSGAGGRVKLTTAADPSGVEAAVFATSWTAGGFNNSPEVWQDNDAGGAGALELDVVGGSWDNVTVWLKSGSAGPDTYLTALNIWLKEA